MGAPQPLGPDGIMSWSALTGVTIRPDEVEILRSMDHAYRAAMAEEAREQSAKYQQQTPPAKP